MANLIITVISIALVAVAALMGAYYGGAAFLDGQVKAKANSIVNSLNQVDTAIQMYNSLTGNIYNGSTITTYNSLNFLVPNYLTAIPQIGAKALVGCNPYMNSGGFTDGKIFVYRYHLNDYPMPRPVIMSLIEDEKICKKVEALRTGTEPTTLRNYGDNFPGGDWGFTGKIGCIADNRNYCTGKDYYLVYQNPYGPPAP